VRTRTLEDANQKLTVQVIDLTGRLAASDAMAKHLTDRNTELEDEVKALDREVKELRQEVYEWRTGTRKITNSQQGTQ
jgi:predicted RNase H-like nuclease (RuvC/YqgF family)